MTDLILFINSFLEYFWKFGLSIVLIVIAVFAGVKWRIAKDKKEALEESSGNSEAK